MTDRYTKAIEQLGSDNLEVCLGGIYALERVSRDSARDHPTVMEVLTAFIRDHSREPWPPPNPGGQERERSTRPDVQAAVTVVARRDPNRDIPGRRIDLTGANLTGAALTYAQLRGAVLAGAVLAGADLRGAVLEAADLRDAVLTGADLHGFAFLIRADLRGADLRDADLRDADLTHANLTDATLTHAALARAKWPDDAPVPEGWEVDIRSGRLFPARSDSASTEGN